MSLRTRLTAARRSIVMGLSLAAMGALGASLLSAPAAAGPAHQWSDVGSAYGYGAYASAPDQDYRNRAYRGYAGCQAAARRLLGRIVKGTQQRAVHRRMDRACEVALMDCRTSLENLRRGGKRGIRTAKCKVQHREHNIAAPIEYRCTAKAFTRRGHALSRTRAIRVRADERRACAAALQRCEHRLDAKRWNEGRRFRRARCEVVRSREIASTPHGYRGGRPAGYQHIDYRN